MSYRRSIYIVFVVWLAVETRTLLSYRQRTNDQTNVAAMHKLQARPKRQAPLDLDASNIVFPETEDSNAINSVQKESTVVRVTEISPENGTGQEEIPQSNISSVLTNTQLLVTVEDQRPEDQVTQIEILPTPDVNSDKTSNLLTTEIISNEIKSSPSKEATSDISEIMSIPELIPNKPDHYHPVSEIPDKPDNSPVSEIPDKPDNPPIPEEVSNQIEKPPVTEITSDEPEKSVNTEVVPDGTETSSNLELNTDELTEPNKKEENISVVVNKIDKVPDSYSVSEVPQKDQIQPQILITRRPKPNRKPQNTEDKAFGYPNYAYPPRYPPYLPPRYPGHYYYNPYYPFYRPPIYG